MACAHSELSTGHCGSRIGTKILQDDSWPPPPPDQPNDRFQLVMMLSKAGRRKRFAAAPSRCGGLLAGVFSAPIHGRLGIPADVPALKFAVQVWKAFVIRPFPKIGATRSTHFALAGAAAFVSVHTLSARMPRAPPASSFSVHAGSFRMSRYLPTYSAQAKARRDAERGRVRSAVTRTARA